MGNDGLKWIDILGLITPPDWLNTGVTTYTDIINGGKKPAFRVSSMTTGVWDAENNCCTITNHAKYEDGFVDVRLVIYYYNAPDNFGTAFLKNLLQKLLEEATDAALEKAKYLQILLDLNDLIHDSYRDSLPPGSKFGDNSIVYGREEVFGNFTPFKAADWQALSSQSLKISEEECEKRNKFNWTQIRPYGGIIR